MIGSSQHWRLDFASIYRDTPMLTPGFRRVLQVIGMCSLFGVAVPAVAVPSFARQTGMACAACHTVFPELTPFGREFKLNGYVLDNIKQVTGIDTSARSEEHTS